MNNKKNAYTLLLILPILAIVAFGLADPSKSEVQTSAGLTITAKTDHGSYLLHQKVTLGGNVTLGGSPTTNLVVGVEVSNPFPFEPYFFRTLQIGNPTGPWLVSINSIYIQDMSSSPIDTVKAGQQIQVGMSVYNTQSSIVTVFATTTVYDANMVALGTNFWTSNIDPVQSATSKFMMQIPSWATSGRALIIGCVYSNEPSSGGIAYCPEKAFYYSISRTQSGLLGITQPPQPPPQTTPGVYVDPIRLPPDPTPGQYSVYVLGQSSPAVISSATTSFTVQSTNGIPPQASFAYWPANATIHATVSFDASSSSPEGYNDVITSYVWNFGDGTPNYVSTGNPPDPTATHTFTPANQYVVTLNVTNNEGLWSTTSKPITIGAGYGPTANFTWTPQIGAKNQTISFDASGSTPGDYSTLTNYTWNFSDGSGLLNVSIPQTTHSWLQPGNYTVTLTVKDSINRIASTFATVQILNSTVKYCDVNNDGKIDGKDLGAVAYSFGSAAGPPPIGNWNPACDVNHDGKVDGKDLGAVASYFGRDP